MKNNILLILIFLTGIGTSLAQQQLPVWSDDFDDEDVSDWQLIDVDEDGNNWHTTGRLAVDENDFSVSYDDNYKVLASYGMDFQTFEDYSPLDNWAISPEISLEAGGGYVYGGTLTLVLDAQLAVGQNNSIRQLDVYISTNPDINDLEGSFTYAGALDLTNPNDSSFGPYPPQFAIYELDVTEFIEANSNFYIALRHTRPQANGGSYPSFGFEIDEFTLQASEVVLSTEDINITKKLQLMQNPVTDRLRLQLRDGLNSENIQVEVYDITGKKIMQNTYTENGLDVSSLAKGLYLARVTNTHAATTLKFIKQ